MPENKPYIEDTIVASASAAGIGGVNIIRISGPKVEEIMKNILRETPKPRLATHRKFFNNKSEVLDMGIAIYFPCPFSFTGESVLELHAHGGTYIGSAIIDEIIDLGARQAEAGEFTKRAFLNGKLDLIQAEAVADLVSSGSKKSAQAAMRSLSGVFSNLIEVLSKKLIKLRLHVEAAIDFPEEEIDFLTDDDLLREIKNCESSFKSVMDGAATGQILNDGIQVAIIGLPNAGKSSLLNLISGQDTAIVNHAAGTTRDIIKANIEIDGLCVEFFDTAGFRENPEEIEAEGIRRTNALLKTVDLAIWVHDYSEKNKIDTKFIPIGLKHILALNKIDLLSQAPDKIIYNNSVYFSANTGEGLENLFKAIKKCVAYESIGDGAFTARTRHIEALKRAYNHFKTGQKALQEQKAGEIFAEEIKLSHKALGEITGHLSDDELLGKIFSEFCIGK
ncbi:MAG: tRNA uridine-5-carboxymethylaminomethyl(34) synthesis GTPase MnmE [Pseudomonadota bacterium]|nr:tRNA uridine-5-carboxymethylaminomethyl(34) synthesis GTPase MnmE [Pseudomonadota bacterium]